MVTGKGYSMSFCLVACRNYHREDADAGDGAVGFGLKTWGGARNGAEYNHFPDEACTNKRIPTPAYHYQYTVEAVLIHSNPVPRVSIVTTLAP